MSCPTCQLPISEVAFDRQCPFCSAVFSRVDGARRHAKRCPRRGNRILQTGKRGRKAFSCERCSLVKIHCNARLQTPCDGCAAKKLKCTFERCCTCGDGPHSRAAISHTSSPRKTERRNGAVPVSFLLNFTDETQDFITERAVGEEPNSHLLGPISATHRQPRTLGDAALSEHIDPTLFLPSDCSDALVPWDEGIGGLIYGEEQDLFSNLLCSQTHADDLEIRISMLESHITAHAIYHNLSFDAASFRQLFSVSNIYTYAETFCRKRHYRYPVIHWPTFVLEEAPVALLLVIALTGASYSYGRDHEPKHCTMARKLYPLADSFVFEQLSACLEDGSNTTEAIQLCQAALLMYGLDTLMISDVAMQRTAITQRLPALVSALRSLNLVGTQHDNVEEWPAFLQRESIIRLVSWTFCADCLATLSYNNPPLFSITEMTGDLPCDLELWDCDSAIDFELLRYCRTEQHSRSLNCLLSSFLGNKSQINIDLDDLSLFHLHIILCAFQPVIFNMHVTLTLVSQATKLLDGLSTWRNLWGRAIERTQDRQWLGVARYIPGIEYFSRRVIGVVINEEETCGKYLERIPSYSMEDIHQFIQHVVAKS